MTIFMSEGIFIWPGFIKKSPKTNLELHGFMFGLDLKVLELLPIL